MKYVGGIGEERNMEILNVMNLTDNNGTLVKCF